MALAAAAGAAPAAAGSEATGSEARSGARRGTEHGTELHRRLGADLWCVTREDLRELRREVVDAMRAGRIVPTPLDAFSPDDQQFGPSIYTVNQQLIKPTTAQAGGMSWALMRHPEGLKCDVFVTHAWQEGIFEFIDKVLNSWPFRARGAWCCMLANPQNLDIGSLIRSPLSSPFAVALRAATFVLVVPNRRSSVYTRLWCAYEAFLAHQWEKTIFTARAPVKGTLFLSTAHFLLCSCAGGALSLVWAPRAFKLVSMAYAFAVAQLMILALVLNKNHVRHVVSCLGGLLSCQQMGLCVRAFLLDDCRLFGFSSKEVLKYPWRRDLVKSVLGTWSFFLVSEFDRVWAVQARVESKELSNSYTGTIADASTSMPGDELSIREEIGPRNAVVDRVIRVLIEAFMSTPSLRRAAEAGVDVSGAARMEYALATWIIYQLVFNTLFGKAGDLVLWAVRATELACTASWVLAFACSPPDARAFALAVLQKLFVVVYLPVYMLAISMHMGGTVSWGYASQMGNVAAIGTWFFVLPITMLRIHRVAALPCLGPRLAQVLAARGLRRLVAACFQPIVAVSPRSPSRLRKGTWRPWDAVRGISWRGTWRAGGGGFVGVRSIVETEDEEDGGDNLGPLAGSDGSTSASSSVSSSESPGSSGEELGTPTGNASGPLPIGCL